MRTTIVVILLSIVSIIAQPKDKPSNIAVPKHNDVGVYLNNTRELYEKPLYTAGVDDRLYILDKNSDSYEVRRPSDGKTGWIKKDEVTVLTKSKSITFQDAEVLGYLDNPTPVYIIDADAKDNTPIKLDRSFSDECRENTDKETITRQTDGN